MWTQLVLVILVSLVNGSLSTNISREWDFVKPPPAKYGNNSKLLQISEKQFQTWNTEDGTNIWEHSGLFEGDIMIYDTDFRNGVLNETHHWPNATVPFFIDQEDFTDEEVMVVLKAFQEYHNRTCIRFRPYEKTDNNWIIIKGNSTGCWSSVGMREKGQVVNISAPKCVKHGVVLHELLHALGFYHQQSASERDDYVIIHWKNIVDKHEYNFRKYNDSVVTSYGVPYDYGSVMHYSSKAFSKNGNATIEPLEKGVKLGQRKELSQKDVTKLNIMYKKTCRKQPMESDPITRFIENLIQALEITLSHLSG